ncbi:MAG: helix-turn-helix domain-containing protein [Woeseiaceae bacterium]
MNTVGAMQRRAAPANYLGEMPNHLESLIHGRPYQRPSKFLPKKALAAQFRPTPPPPPPHSTPLLIVMPPVSETVTPALLTHMIISKFCEVKQLKRTWLAPGSREQWIVRHRHQLMWILKRQSKKSIVAIGKALGGFDHSTVHHGAAKMESDEDLRAEALAVENQVMQLVCVEFAPSAAAVNDGKEN